MNRRELSTTGHGQQVKRCAEQSNVIQPNKETQNNQSTRNQNSKRPRIRNISSAHLRYVSKPTALKAGYLQTNWININQKPLHTFYNLEELGPAPQNTDSKTDTLWK